MLEFRFRYSIYLWLQMICQQCVLVL